MSQAFVARSLALTGFALVYSTLTAVSPVRANAAAQPEATHIVRSSEGLVSVRHSIGGMARGANTNDPWLYVAGSSAVTIYDVSELANQQATQIGQITGISNASGIRLDAAGNLYVASYSANTVFVYPPGATSPSLSISKGLSSPVDVAVDSAGNVYALNRTPPSITVYAPGETTPSKTIKNALLAKPETIAFDAANNLFYSDNKTGVSEIPAGSSVPKSLHLKHAHRSFGITVDQTTGDLYRFGSTGQGGEYVNDLESWHPGSRVPYFSYGQEGDFGSYLALGFVGSQEYLFQTTDGGNITFVWIVGQSQNFTYFRTASGLQSGMAFKPAGVP